MKKPFLFALALVTLPGAVLADPAADLVRDRDVVILGEVHDNPAHHGTQARLTEAAAPKALIFEMLSPDQAGLITEDLRADADAMAAALDWENSGWPDFAMYYQIMQSAPQAAIYGAGIPRDAARAAFEAGIVASFGADASDYGLDQPLPGDQLEARLALQKAAHCDALPGDLLPKMVALQRLRDAILARATLSALDETGGPVVVITGNGHARADWAVPAYLRARDPELKLVSIGQSEDGNAPDGSFDAVIDAPGVDRPDPCAAFR